MVRRSTAHDIEYYATDPSALSALDEMQDILDHLKSRIALSPEIPDGQAGRENASEADELTGAARRIIRQREARRKFLPEGYFEEPAYNILLDLYVATADGRIVYVNDACIASNTPTSTALRWISILVRDGFAARLRDEKDARRTILSITPAGRDSISALLREIRRV